MNRRHARSLWRVIDGWRETVDAMRTSRGTRGDDFEIFHNLRRAGKIPGLGTAYFTKILFFIRPEQDAYIMDQWTAKSVNLLTGRPVVDISPTGWVNHDNDRERYEQFCSVLDHLAEYRRCSGSEIEQAMMSKGGPHPWPWRKYVLSNYQNNSTTAS